MMYFDFVFYRRVLAFSWAQQWPGRRATLTKLLVLVPILAVVNSVFFLLDYLFFPSLWRQRVERPVFIVGHARSGTTLMHRLMAGDGERFSYFLYWETFFPSLTQKKIIKLLGWLDQHVLGGIVLRRLRMIDKRTFDPYRHIHDMSLWNPEEDQFVMGAAFLSQQWAIELPIMHEFDLFHIDDIAPARRRRWLRFYAECVKRQLLLHGGTHTHLSKNPVMSGWVDALLEAFPDARFVVMVRDPLQCVPSTLKLVESAWKARKWPRDQCIAAHDALVRVSFDSFDLPRRALDAHPETPHRFVDYRALVRAPAEVVRDVYAALGLSLSDEFSRSLTSQERDEKAHASRFRYDLSDYGITPQQIEARLERHYAEYEWPRASAERMEHDDQA